MPPRHEHPDPRTVDDLRWEEVGHGPLEEMLFHGAVGRNERADALHIALATVARVDVLVSWHFKHIVNLRRIHAFNAGNLKQGCPVLEIRNPREVIGDE